MKTWDIGSGYLTQETAGRNPQDGGEGGTQMTAVRQGWSHQTRSEVGQRAPEALLEEKDQKSDVNEFTMKGCI